MKRIFSFRLSVLLVILTAIVLSACAPTVSSPPARPPEAKVVESQQKAFTTNQPIPTFDFSLERDILIQLYVKRNEALSTYTVVVDSHGGEIYACPSIGYPIAADTKLTAPEKIVQDRGEYGGGNLTVSQPEPNGTYQSHNTVGTWITCVLEDGTAYPYYTEMNAQTWPFPVTRGEDGSYHMITGAKPSTTITITKPAK